VREYGKESYLGFSLWLDVGIGPGYLYKGKGLCGVSFLQELKKRAPSFSVASPDVGQKGKNERIIMSGVRYQKMKLLVFYCICIVPWFCVISISTWVQDHSFTFLALSIFIFSPLSWDAKIWEPEYVFAVLPKHLSVENAMTVTSHFLMIDQNVEHYKAKIKHHASPSQSFPPGLLNSILWMWKSLIHQINLAFKCYYCGFSWRSWSSGFYSTIQWL
jgi:hypothetical protein